jgi:hypothetical protein
MTLSKVITEVLEANNMANTLQEIWEETSAALRLTKERMAGGELGEVPEAFEIGEKVWLDSRNLWLKTNSPKLTDWRLGPFEVTEKLSDRAYWLRLPENLKIHDVFYVGLLSKVKEDRSRPILTEPDPLEVEGEEEYKVEEIVDSERRQDGWYYEPLQQLALRFRDKHCASEAREITINHVTEKASEVSRSRDIVLASEDPKFLLDFY